MCCSIRAAVFFVGSVHIFFAITQMIQIFPLAVSNLGEKLLVSSLAFVYLIAFFSTGFMTFRGADEESATLIRLASICLFIVIIFRFVLMSFSLMLVETLPEANFLYVYGTAVIPIIFTVIIYLVYEAILFCYHNELKHISIMGAGGFAGSGRSNRGSGHGRLDSPINFHSPRHLRQTHPGGGGGGPDSHTVIP